MVLQIHKLQDAHQEDNSIDDSILTPKIQEGNIVAELGLLREGNGKNARIGNSNARRAFNAAKRICDIEQGDTRNTTMAKSSSVGSLNGALSGDTVKAADRFGTVRGNKMITKALSVIDSDLIIKPDEQEK